MTFRSRGLIILLSLGLIAIVIWWQTTPNQATVPAGLELPEHTPDLYIDAPVQTRFNEDGQPALRARADSLAYYESTGESLMMTPVMTTEATTGQSWQITAELATLFRDGSVNFEENVKVLEQQTPDGLKLYTDWLRVEQNGRFVTTPRPVRLIQPGQEARGVGMDALFSADESDITLKSEVSIRYDAN